MTVFSASPPDSPPRQYARPCRSAGTALARHAARQWREEVPLLKRRWKLIATCAAMQYVHAIAGQLAYRMHRPAPPLHDVGFHLLPELGARFFVASEAVTALAFVCFGLWVLSPFAVAAPRFHTVAALSRMLAVVSACQLLRIAAFSATQLPSPATHCRPGSPTSRLPPARSAADVLLVNVARQVNRGCGDLIFSSHITFTLTMVLIYNHYGHSRAAKAAAWVGVAFNALLIVASRKHYTVDVVVAAFTVPLVWAALDAKLRDPPPPGAAQQAQTLLPR